MEQSPSSEINMSSAIQEISHMLCNQTFITATLPIDPTKCTQGYLKDTPENGVMQAPKHVR